MSLSYTLIRSTRKTLCLHIDAGGNLIVRAPQKMILMRIENYIAQKQGWIEKHQKRMQAIPEKSILSNAEIQIQKQHLKNYIIPRTYELWKGKNLPAITSIKITKSETRWGSCSSKNGLCFSYRLFEFIDSPFIDAIIIHELAHLQEKNHQKSFWDLVTLWMPEYKNIVDIKA